MEPDIDWRAEVRGLLDFILKEWRPNSNQIERMGWCCYCKRKLNERKECGCW